MKNDRIPPNPHPVKPPPNMPEPRKESLEAENARLKAEVDALMTNPTSRLLRTEREENARLKAEVERLTKELSNISGWGRGLESDLSHARVEISFLKAEVERLRSSSFVTAVPVEQYERLLKAGEEVIHEWSSGDEKEARNFMKALVIWNAAKEGKPSK